MTEKNVTVTYTIKPEVKSEHITFINEVFKDLSMSAVNGIDYKVTCLEDGVTFVHVARITTPEGSNPLESLPAFGIFSSTLPERVATKPEVKNAHLIGYYHGIQA